MSSSPVAPYHYCPPDGYFGDPIPFFWNGEYHLFYLIGQFDPWRRVRYTPYRHLLSTDLVNWKELPVAIELGEREDVDMSLGTGTAIERDGTFYFFYCGRTFLPGDAVDGLDEEHWERGARETICVARSKDLIKWEKDPGNPILKPDGVRYQETDFRDPYVFWNEKEGRYWMVMSVKITDTSLANVGALGLATSNDLENWELEDPLWAPHLSRAALECPDVFRIGEKWYMFYSANATTFYRVADSPEGPWAPAEPDICDNLAFYAAKIFFTGNRRFLVGWIPTRQDENDEGRFRWGGHCAIPRELVQLPDGALAQRCPPEIINIYHEIVPLAIQRKSGEWTQEGHTISALRTDGFAYAVIAYQKNGLIQLSLRMKGDNCSAGVVFRAGPDLSTYYVLRLEPARKRTIIERVPHIAEVKFRSERELVYTEGQNVDIKLFLDGSIIEAFVAERGALCCRAYDFAEGEIGLYVEHGEAFFTNVSMRDL